MTVTLYSAYALANSATGTVSNPNNATGAEDGSVYTTDVDNTSWDSTWTLDTSSFPAGAEFGGSGSVSVWARKDTGTGTPTLDIYLLLDDIVVDSSLARSVTSTTGMIFSLTVTPAAILAAYPGATPASVPKIRLVATAAGGSPSSRCTAQIDAMRWQPDLVAGTTYSVTGTVAATSGVSASVDRALAVSGTVAAVSGASAAVEQLLSISGTVPAVSGASAEVTSLLPTTGTVAAVSGASAEVTSLLPTTGTVAAVSGASADVTILAQSDPPVADAGPPQTVPPSGSATPLSVVQQASPGTEFNGAAVVVSFASAPTPGNHLLFVFHSTAAVPDDPPAGVTEVAYADDAGRPTKAYLRQVQSGDGTDWSFASTNVATATNEAHGYEIAGLADSPVDVVVIGTAGTYTSMQVGSTGTLSQADELVLVGVGLGGTSGGGESITSPTITVDGASDHVRTINGVLIVSATTALNPTISWTTSRRANGFILTLKKAPAGAPSPVYLDGTNSSDDVGIVSALWEIIGNTTGEPDPTITNPTSLSTAEFNAPEAEGTITVQLTVTDGESQQSTDTVVITIQAASISYTWHVQGGSDTAVTGLQWHNQGGSDDTVTTTDWHIQV